MGVVERAPKQHRRLARALNRQGMGEAGAIAVGFAVMVAGAPASLLHDIILQAPVSADQQAIEAAILEHSGLADAASAPYTIVVEAEAEGYARATLQPKDPATTEAAIVYLKQESDRWVVLVVGSAFEPGLLDSLGVPRGIRHGDS